MAAVLIGQMRTLLSVLAVGWLAGCAGAVQTPTIERERALDVTVSTEWSPAQQEQILAAVGWWSEQLPASVPVSVSVGACDAGARDCVAPVDLDDPLLADEDLSDGRAVGAHYRGAVVMWREWSDLEILGAHELGHYLGFDHEPEGVMAPGTGEMELVVSPLAAAALAGL